MDTNKKNRTVNINISTGTIILIVAAIVLLGGGAINKAVTYNELTASEVEHALKDESDIVTQSDTIKISATYRSVKKLGIELPLTENKEKFSAKGIVKGGYNLNKIKVTTDNENKIIKIKMPKMKIIAKELDMDSIEHESLKTSIFNWKDMDYGFDLTGDLEKELVKQAKMNEEFEEKALSHAEQVIGNLINKIEGSEGYTIICI